jgi:hypothetical protein
MLKPIDFYRLFENKMFCGTVQYDIFCLKENIISHLANQNLDVISGSNPSSLAFAGMRRAEAQRGMARGDHGEARRAKSDGFGVVPVGFAMDRVR